MPKGSKQWRGTGKRLAAVTAIAALSDGVSAAEDALPEGSPAAAGERVYAVQCASCHGAAGEGYIGPPVMGEGAALGVYENGQRLLDYIGQTMPQTNPGGLSDEEYRQVLAFMLVRNGLVDPDWSPEEQPPEEVSLKPSE